MDEDIVAGWSEFAVAMAGVAAVLAGLVFVALSVNLSRILSTPGLAGRAGESVILFLASVVHCALLLVPAQSRHALGVELICIGVLEWAVLLAVGLTGVRSPTRQPPLWQATRVVTGQLATLPVILGGVLLAGDVRDALYCVGAAILWAIVVGTANAWVLVVEVVRDERYRRVGEGE